MKQSAITRINGVDICTVEKDGQVFVPVKPICEAIGVNYVTQLEKLKSDETFAPSTVPLRGIVAADGKEREMICLPLLLVYLWIGTISPANVSTEARPKVVAYRLECAQALYDHFTGHLRQTLATNEAEIALLKDINAAISDEREAKGRRKKAEEALDKLRAERLNPQPTIF